MKSILLRTLIVLIIGMTLLFGRPTAISSSALPVSVKLGGTGATSWAIGNMEPGDSGYRDVTLTNDGIVAGKADIWINNLVGHDGTPSYMELNPPPNGDMPNNLLLSISGSGLQSDFTMPALVTDFPHGTASDTNHLWIDSLDPGQTADLEWTWSLPTYAGNAVQGDSLSFDISYSLTQLYDIPQSPSGGSGPIYVPPQTAQPAPVVAPPAPVATQPSAPAVQPPAGAQELTIGLTVPQAGASTGISSDGITSGTLSVSTPDNKFSMSIDPGTQILGSSDRPNTLPDPLAGVSVPTSINVTEKTMDVPPFPAGWIGVSPTYDISAQTNGLQSGITLDKPAVISIAYDQALLPSIVDNIAVFYYDPVNGWTQLAPPPGMVASKGVEAAQVSNFYLFAVLAKPGTAKALLPAQFAVQRLLVDPPSILVGHSSDVKVTVANTGQIAGQYIVIVKVNGLVQKTQTVTLKPGEKREIDLTLAPGTTGSYTIQAGNINDVLLVNPRPEMELIETDYWWLLFISLGIATLLMSLVQKTRKKVTSGDQEDE